MNPFLKEVVVPRTDWCVAVGGLVVENKVHHLGCDQQLRHTPPAITGGAPLSFTSF